MLVERFVTGHAAGVSHHGLPHDTAPLFRVLVQHELFVLEHSADGWPQVGGKGGPSGLAHISELSDGFVGNIHAEYKTDQGDRAAPPAPPAPCHRCLRRVHLPARDAVHGPALPAVLPPAHINSPVIWLAE